MTGLEISAALGTTLQIVDLPYCHFVFKRINLQFLLYFVVFVSFFDVLDAVTNVSKAPQ